MILYRLSVVFAVMFILSCFIVLVNRVLRICRQKRDLQKSPLLSQLPVEIRLEIYRHLLVNTSNIDRPGRYVISNFLSLFS